LASAFADVVAAGKTGNLKVVHSHFFDTVLVDCGPGADDIYQAALKRGFNLRRVSDTVLGVAFHEESSAEDFAVLTRLFTGSEAALPENISGKLSADVLRGDAILSHEVFNRYHTEHEMLRYLKKLENKDLALNHSMISLGSCTMKLNATAEMLPVTWPEFSPYPPVCPGRANGKAILK
jgi:glycine dehydrogenase